MNVSRNWQPMHATLATANIPSSTILVTLMMEALSSSETSVLARVTRRHIPGDDVLLNIWRDRTELTGGHRPVRCVGTGGVLGSTNANTNTEMLHRVLLCPRVLLRPFGGHQAQIF
jgi:hypothetical protein